MRLIGAGLTVIAVATAAGATSVAVGSSAQWHFVEVPSLDTFVRLANQTIAFVNERTGSAPVPALPALRQGVGLRLAETFGSTLRWGVHVAVASITTHVQGTWTVGGTPHPVEIGLDAALASVAAEVSLVLVPDILVVSVAAGWGSSRIGYRCVFPRALPTDWSLPFLPKAEEKAYFGDGPLGALAVQLSLPLGRGASAGLEIGLRVSSPSVPRAGTTVLDLNADGMGDPVALSSLWLGLTVRMEFSL